MPMISNHPSSELNVNAGIDVSFSVTATGEELVYRWMKDGVDIFDTPFKYTGTDSNSLTVLSVNDPDDEGTYSVTVGNAVGTALSNAATLSISKYFRASIPLCILLHLHETGARDVFSLIL